MSETKQSNNTVRSLSLSHFLFLFLWYWGLNSGPALEPLHQSFFLVCVCVMGFFKTGSRKLLARAGFKMPPDLCLLSS
jgi:hypothetical protein